jgi:hypothetical protein
MRNWFNGSIVAAVLATAAVSAVISLSVARGQGQAARPARTPNGQPNFNGVWQALNEAHWDLQSHEARAGMVTQKGVYDYEYARVPAAPVVALGAAAGVPGSLGVVQGDGQIPYRPEAAAIKKENSENWIDRDPELKCYLPGVPRAMYMPYPFAIVQGTDKIHMTYAFSNAGRVIHMNKVAGPPDDTYMGHSVGHWEKDTLVVEVSNFNGKKLVRSRRKLSQRRVAPCRALFADQRGCHPLRGDDHRSEGLHASVDDRHAALSPTGAECDGYRLSVHGVFGRVHVRASSKAATGQAVGRRDDDRGDHPQDSAGRASARLVQKVGG